SAGIFGSKTIRQNEIAFQDREDDAASDHIRFASGGSRWEESAGDLNHVNVALFYLRSNLQVVGRDHYFDATLVGPTSCLQVFVHIDTCKEAEANCQSPDHHQT